MTCFPTKNPGEPWDGFLQETSHATDDKWLNTLAGKSILVTGAGGYIGSALARSLASLPVRRLLLLDTAEHGLYLLDQELQANRSAPEYSMLVGSVSNERFVQEVFQRGEPQIIFHAAALKHVQLMERNPFAAVETNALGTRRIAEAAARYTAEQLILISTDKAVDPISIMGASKRLAELVLLSCQSSTKMTTVRLCNVLGSTGSVAPLFLQQINRHLSVTVTDREATRYFLSLERTVACLLSAAVAVHDGLLVPQTGAAYRIDDLAHFLIEKSAANTSIRYTRLRTGDKLHEQLTSSREQMAAANVTNELVSVYGPPVDAARLNESLNEILQAISQRDLLRLLQVIRQMVPEYVVSERLTKLSISHKMEAP